MPSKLERVTFTFQGKRYTVRGETLEEAKVLAKLKKKELEKASTLEENPDINMKVDEWFEKYMDVYKVNASDKTLDNYRYVYRSGIKPYIGNSKMQNVKPIDCQTVLNKAAVNSYSYVHKVRILLRGMFKTAHDNDIIKKNPAASITMPPAKKGTRRALTPEEREAFLTASYEAGEAGLFCRIIYYCGLRPSEVARIRGGDYQNGRLKVRGQKTAAASRTVPIPDALELPKVAKGKLLFKANHGGELQEGGFTSCWVKVRNAMEKNGPVADDLVMYCLRHDYCTRLEEAGVPINVASRFMGHSSVEVTAKIYTHDAERSFADAALKINAYSQQVSQR